MSTLCPPTQGQVRLPLTASTLAEVHAYLNETPFSSRPHVALDKAPDNPVLCFPNGNATYAVPLTIGQSYSSLPPYYAQLLRAALHTDCPYLLEDWLDEQWLMAWSTKRFTQPASYLAPYLGDGIALLTRQGVRCYHPDVIALASQRIVTPFYAPPTNSRGVIVDPMVTLVEETLPYAQEAIALLPHVASDHPTEPRLMRWLLACSYVAGQPRSHWCAPAREILNTSLSRS